jgi:hypothetical protein
MKLSTTFGTTLSGRALYIVRKSNEKRMLIYNCINSKLENNIRLLLKHI